MKVVSAKFAALALVLAALAPAARASDPRVGVIGLQATPGEDAQAVLAAIGGTYVDASAPAPAFADLDVLWWHETDTWTVPPALLEGKLATQLRDFVENGGGLILTGFAPQYAVPLGVQKAPPTSVVTDPGRSGNWGFTPRCSSTLFRGLGSPAITLDAGNRTKNILCWWDNAADFDGEWLADSEARSGKVALGEWRLGKGRILFAGSGALTFEQQVNPNATRQQLVRRLVERAATPVNDQLMSEEGLVAYWPLNGDAQDVVSGATDKIHNNFNRPEFVGIDEGKAALRCDGFSTWIERDAGCAPFLAREFTLSAWVAAANYPVQDAPFVAQQSGGAGWSMLLNRYGQWGVRVMLDGVWHAVWSPEPLPTHEWKHLAATLDTNKGALILFENGEEIARTTTLLGARVNLATDAPLMLGKASDSGAVAEIFPTAVYNGLLDDVKIHRAAKSAGALAQDFQRGSGRSAPDLSIPESRFAQDPHRPVYHILPPSNWTNEPHGFVQSPDGRYHLFNQENPSGPYWSFIHWGHYSSDDLVHWRQEPLALAPAPGLDREGVWSGDAVIDDNGDIVLVYTAVDGVKAAVCLAYPDGDGGFKRWQGNPAIAGRPKGMNFLDFRDPYLYRDEKGGPWHLIIGAGVPEVGGTALHYTSDDLHAWDYKGQFLTGDKASSGFFWEMPVLVDLGDKYFFGVTELPGRNSYWLGHFDGEKFTPENAEPTRLEIMNHYLSPTVAKEKSGREVAIGIIPETRSSKAQLAAGWAHCYGIPRVWGLDAQGRLTQEPAPELHALRGVEKKASSITINSAGVTLGNGIEGDTGELQLEFAPQSSGTVAIELRRSPDGEERTVLEYNFATGEVVLDRTQSSLDAENVRDRQTGTFLLDEGEPLRLTVFLDRSVLEFFFNGRGTMASRVYPTRRDAIGIRLSATGGEATLAQARFWTMGTIWQEKGDQRGERQREHSGN